MLPSRSRGARIVTLTIGEALSVLLPTGEETALLRACLHSGDSARDGWERWRAGRTAPPAELCTALAQWRTLLPLLERSAVRNDLDVGRDVLPYLRATTLREELRTVRYRKIVAGALTALEDAGITAFVVRGAALAATVYDAWPLRHCHDLDLLVDAEMLDTAVSALGRAGFRQAPGSPALRTDAIAEHPSGLQIALHTRPFVIAYNDAVGDSFTRGSRHITIEGVRTRAPSPEATLVHVLGHATYSSSRRNLRWVADAWHILSRHRDLEWDDVLARIAVHRLDLPVSVLLGYLAEFGVAVPARALMLVRERAACADPLAEDVALGGVTAATQGDVVGIWRSMRSWRGRLRLVRWAVAPTREYLRGAFSVPSDWLIPLCYLYRPARFVVGTLVRRAPPADAPRAPQAGARRRAVRRRLGQKETPDSMGHRGA